jgi:hypothetical protein
MKRAERLQMLNDWVGSGKVPVVNSFQQQERTVDERRRRKKGSETIYEGDALQIKTTMLQCVACLASTALRITGWEQVKLVWRCVSLDLCWKLGKKNLI